MIGRQNPLQTPNEQLVNLKAVPSGVIVPRPSTPQGGRRRYVISMPLVRIDAVSETFAYNTTATFRVQNPSVRLRLKVAILYQPDLSGSVIPQSGVGGVYLSLQAADRTEDGRLLPSNSIVTALPCPTSWEALTMNDGWLGTVTLPKDGGGHSNIDAGFLMAVAAWEPEAGWNGDDRQLAEIFEACQLYIGTGQRIAA